MRNSRRAPASKPPREDGPRTGPWVTSVIGFMQLFILFVFHAYYLGTVTWNYGSFVHTDGWSVVHTDDL